MQPLCHLYLSPALESPHVPPPLPHPPTPQPTQATQALPNPGVGNLSSAKGHLGLYNIIHGPYTLSI